MPMPSLQFPSAGLQVLSALIHFFGVSILAHCISRRVARERFLCRDGWSQLSWPRLCVLLVFLDSWLFLFCSGILIFGVGLETHIGVCSAAIYLCIACYSTSKLLIYAFLIERVYVVWTPATGARRLKSPVYIICLITVAIYAGVIASLLAGRIFMLRSQDMICMIGLQTFASVPLLSYDLYINLFLTALFLAPLLKSTSVNPRLRSVARRALIASTIALTTSTANIVILTVLHGTELGWVCLGSCGADVIVNAVVLFWATTGKSPEDDHHRSRTTSSFGEFNSKLRSREVRFTDPEFLRSSLGGADSPVLPTFTYQTSSVLPQVHSYQVNAVASPSILQKPLTVQGGPHRNTTPDLRLDTQGLPPVQPPRSRSRSRARGSSINPASPTESTGTVASGSTSPPTSPSTRHRQSKNDPYHPFSPASFTPKNPEPVVTISVGTPMPALQEEWEQREKDRKKAKAVQEPPNAMRSLINLFRPVPPEYADEVKITVTTENGVEYEYDLESYDEHGDQDRHSISRHSV